MLTTNNKAKATRLAGMLDGINAQRKAIETRVTESALEQFQGRTPGTDRKIAIALIEDAHEGVVGISAGRLKEAHDCPRDRTDP